MASPLLINIFAAAIEVLKDLVYLEAEAAERAAEIPVELVRRVVSGASGDAVVEPRSAEGLARMMIVIAEVFAEFDLAVKEKKAETLRMRARVKQATNREPPPLPPPP